MKKILITGSAGFIGFHLSLKLIESGYIVIGIDSIEKSYGKKIKLDRLKILKKKKNFKFYKINIKNIDSVKENVDLIIHLAAEAGVRRSLIDPYFYIQQNINCTIKVFEFAKKRKIKKIIYASSSSVYGNNKEYPSNEMMNVMKPLSIYGVTKIANENIAYYYNEIFKINSIGLRFFTVYGPYGRPDMSIFIFFKCLLKNKKIILFNHGKNLRDYTYIEDITLFINKLLSNIKNKKRFFEIFNIGGQKNITLNKVVKIMEKITCKKTSIKRIKKNKLDPENSLASMKKLEKYVNFKKNTPIDLGLQKTYEWIKNYL
jgi:UDP-glucuronate 4-epimerase